MSLARGLAELRAENGESEFEVTLVTQTPRENFDDEALPFPVVRQPGFWKLLRFVRNADVVHIAGPALEPLLLGLLQRKPVVIEHHGFQVICPTGQLLIESRSEPCPGHFMAGHRAECWKCDPALGWFDLDYLGIDQGPIIAMIENHRSDLVWRTMRGNPAIRLGLERAGFTGGWLSAAAAAKAA